MYFRLVYRAVELEFNNIINYYKLTYRIFWTQRVHRCKNRRWLRMKTDGAVIAQYRLK